MKKLKSIFFAATLLASIPFLQSCLDDNESVPTFVDWATVKALESDINPVTLSGDTEGLLSVTNGNILKSYKADSVGQRVFCNFVKNVVNNENSLAQSSTNMLQMTSITIYELYKVLTKNMDTLVAGEEDEYGTDPINIIGNAYTSEAHLNIQFQILTGSNEDVKHRISLVAEPDAVPDSKGYLTVELRHNAGEDSGNRLSWGLVSYTLESMPGYKEGTLKGFNIKCNTIYDGERIFEVAISNKKSAALPTGITLPNTKTK